MLFLFYGIYITSDFIIGTHKAINVKVESCNSNECIFIIYNFSNQQNNNISSYHISIVCNDSGGVWTTKPQKLRAGRIKNTNSQNFIIHYKAVYSTKMLLIE